MAPKIEDLTIHSDEALMGAYQKGEVQAFEVLLHRHQQSVFHHLYRFLNNKEAAEEATQEVFLHIIRAAQRYEPTARFTTWMYRIVHNYGIDCIRRGKLRKTESLDAGYDDADGHTLMERYTPEQASPEEEFVDKEIHDHLQVALASLNPDQREVFLMRENLGLPFHEIARTLHVSTNTVKSRMRYALSTLKKTLRKQLKPVKLVAQ